MNLLSGPALLAASFLLALPNPTAAQDGALAQALESARVQTKASGASLGKGDFVHVTLPAGELEGVEVQSTGWSPLKVIDPWWGEATMVVIGHPSGTTIKPVHNESGWGHSLGIRPSRKWDGRIWFVDLTIQGSGSNAVDIGYWGQAAERPLKDIRFIDCTFVDHPLESVRTVRPISANQAAMLFIGCTWDMPNSIEHAVYSRNPYGVSGMVGCTVKAVGGQVWQEVNRPEEGPYFPGGLTLLANSWFENYHQDPSRAGSALTFTGGRDVVVSNCVVLDIERPEGEHSYGGFVSWDGGQYYATDGTAIYPEDKPEVGQFANGTLEITHNLFVQKQPDRAIVKIDSCEFAIVRNNGFYGTRPVEVASHVNSQGQPTDAGVGGLVWQSNNGPFPKSLAIALGIPNELLIEPKLLVAGKTVGKAKTNISF